ADRDTVTATLYLRDKPVCKASMNLSRPDLARLFPDHPRAIRSGFRFRYALSLAARNGDSTLSATVRFSTGGGIVTERAVTVVLGNMPTSSGSASLLDEVAKVIAEFERRHDRSPAILDWDTGLHLEDMFPDQTVFSPEFKRMTLPYLDRSIDVVVIASD